MKNRLPARVFLLFLFVHFSFIYLRSVAPATSTSKERRSPAGFFFMNSVAGFNQAKGRINVRSISPQGRSGAVRINLVWANDVQ